MQQFEQEFLGKINTTFTHNFMSIALTSRQKLVSHGYNLCLEIFRVNFYFTIQMFKINFL